MFEYDKLQISGQKKVFLGELENLLFVWWCGATTWTPVANTAETEELELMTVGSWFWTGAGVAISRAHACEYNLRPLNQKYAHLKIGSSTLFPSSVTGSAEFWNIFLINYVAQADVNKHRKLQKWKNSSSLPSLLTHLEVSAVALTLVALGKGWGASKVSNHRLCFEYNSLEISTVEWFWGDLLQAFWSSRYGRLRQNRRVKGLWQRGLRWQDCAEHSILDTLSTDKIKWNKSQEVLFGVRKFEISQGQFDLVLFDSRLNKSTSVLSSALPSPRQLPLLHMGGGVVWHQILFPY